MTLYSVKQRTREYVKVYRFLLFMRSLSNRYGKKLLGTAAKTGINAL